MTSFLSAGELAQLRADADRTLLDATCTLLTPVAGTNSIGEVALSWGTLGAAVPCRLRPAGNPPALALLGGQPQTVAGWQLTLPHGTTTVQPGDRAVVAGVTYEVMQTWDEETWRTATRVEVKRIEV
jgi:hypothetical protein